VLTRELAMQNHYPAIDVLASVSRLERDLLASEQAELIGRAREALAIYRRKSGPDQHRRVFAGEQCTD